MLQWPLILTKVQPHQRVQVTKRGSGTLKRRDDSRTFEDIEFALKKTMKRGRRFEERRRIEDGRQSIEDDPRSGRPIFDDGAQHPAG
ncbi:hypothetical protein LAZ67_19002067 [Cordylochernes scorpioides]|uniref:Uncharacterized protein n=1 Tax=Cordylochernes scorpioides TaxID=51811 RepID=A0ABY6LI57_9ARAC|nr:hypothetical protein LAZ67_19002067 [Cordylochernes scorpioides]